MKSGKIRRDKAVLVVIDIQERLLPFIKSNEEVVRKAAMLIRGAKILGIPIIPLEQYPKGLGSTVPEIKEALDGLVPIEKTSFSAYGEAAFLEVLKKIGAEDVMLCGIETHVCVEQTALDLINAGYRVYMIEDATGSRNNNDRKYAGRRIVEAGGVGTTVEAALFEILIDAKDPSFKEISNLVK